MSQLLAMRRMHLWALSLFAVVLALPFTASAQDIEALDPPARATESPIWGNFELRLGSYRPDIDKEFGGQGVYADTFGGGKILAELALSGYVYDGFGQVGVGGALGFWNKKAKATDASGEETADVTRLMIIPARAEVYYRFDYLEERFNVPLVLRVGLGLDYYFWNVYASGKVADAPSGDKLLAGRGGTWGWHYEVALYFLLDSLAPRMAAAFDSTAGVNNSYVFISFTGTHVSDFGSDSSWSLSDNMLRFGIAFEF